MGGRWTKREIAWLTLKYSNSSWIQLKQFLPGRSAKSIEKKAFELRLTRPMFSTKKGLFWNFAVCPTHGRILKMYIKMTGKHLNIPTCSKCNSRVKILPKSSKLRRKYRNG